MKKKTPLDPTPDIEKELREDLGKEVFEFLFDDNYTTDYTADFDTLRERKKLRKAEKGGWPNIYNSNSKNDKELESEGLEGSAGQNTDDEDSLSQYAKIHSIIRSIVSAKSRGGKGQRDPRYRDYIIETLKLAGGKEDYGYIYKDLMPEELGISASTAHKQVKQWLGKGFWLDKKAAPWELTLERKSFTLLTKEEQIERSRSNREQSQYCLPAYDAELNDLLNGGIRRGAIHGWAIETGHGKTTMACECAVNMALQGYKTQILAIESAIEDYFTLVAQQLNCPVEEAEEHQLIHITDVNEATDIDEMVSALKRADFDLIIIDHNDPEIIDVTGEQDAKVRQIGQKVRQKICRASNFSKKPAIIITYQIDFVKHNQKNKTYDIKISFSGATKWKQPLICAFVQVDKWTEYDNVLCCDKYCNNIMVFKRGSYNNMKMKQNDIFYREISEKTQRAIKTINKPGKTPYDVKKELEEDIQKTFDDLGK